MKILKGILLGLICLLTVFLIFAAMLPGEYELQQSIDVKVTPDRVYASLSDFEQHLSWDPYFENISTSDNQIEGEAGQLLHAISWKSASDREELFEITQIIENEMIQIAKVGKMIELNTWELRPLRSDSSSVIWTTRRNLNFPIERIAHFMGSSALESDMFNRLQSLKLHLE